MALKQLLATRKAGPRLDRAGLEAAIRATTAARQLIQSNYDDAKLAQLDAPLNERAMMEEFVQRLAGQARLLEEALQRLNDAHHAEDGILEREAILQQEASR